MRLDSSLIKKGLAAGLITGAMGGASVIAAPIAHSLIANFGVHSAFIYLGTAYLLIIIVALFFIKVAPANYQPEGWVQPVAEIKKEAVNKNLETNVNEFIILLYYLNVCNRCILWSNGSIKCVSYKSNYVWINSFCCGNIC